MTPEIRRKRNLSALPTELSEPKFRDGFEPPTTLMQGEVTAIYATGVGRVVTLAPLPSIGDEQIGGDGEATPDGEDLADPSSDGVPIENPSLHLAPLRRATRLETL